MTRVLVLGAHPDDCDIFAGGTALRFRRRGDIVMFVSMTDGSAGHATERGDALAARRREEARRAGEIFDLEYRVLEHRDGELEPSLANRQQLIRLWRDFRPDLVLTHRPGDYHPDHRYTAQLVADTAFLVTVPAICPEKPALAVNPVIAYLYDEFERPVPFRADVVVDISDVVERKWDALHCHASQFYEWLPVNLGAERPVPSGDAKRRAWLERQWGPFFDQVAIRHADRIREIYPAETIARARQFEAFELCEFGGAATREELLRLFPVE